MKEKACSYLGMALLPFLFLGLELLVLFIESLFYGTMDFSEISALKGISVWLIHWGLTCLVWGIGAWLLVVLAKKRGFDVFENKFPVPAMNWVIVLILVALSVAGSYLAWDMQFKFLAELGSMKNLFGDLGVVAFIAQYVYYLFESVLILAVIVFGQKFGEHAFRKSNIPWGGILCCLTWGLTHILTQGLFTGIYAAVSAVAYGIVYVLLKRNVRYAYPILALMFVV